MSQYVAELCALLVKDTYGDLYSIIYSSLINHGRQPLIRIMRDTGLNRRQVMYGLAVLIQQHLIYHFTSVDDGLTYYEANWKSTYYFARCGKIIQVTKERFGGYAATVMDTILRLGHTTVAQLETLPELRVKKKQAVPRAKLDVGDGNDDNKDSNNDEDEALFMDEQPAGAGADAGDGGEQLPTAGENGDIMDVDMDGGGEGEGEEDDDEEESAAQLHTTLSLLASHACIMRVRPAHFQSPGDLRDEVENALRSRSDIRALKGKRQDDAIAQGIELMTKERLDGRIAAPVPQPVIPVSGLKRKADDDDDNGDIDGPRKRTKLQDGMAAADEGVEDEDEDDDADEGVGLDGNMVIRVNFAKFDVLFRNQRLIDFARENTTDVTSHVYAALLSRIETRTSTCRALEERLLEGEEAEQYSVAVSLQTVANDIDPDVDLMSVFGGNGPTDKGRADPLDADDFGDGDGDASSTAGARNRVFEVEQHLSYLAQEPYHFATRKMNTGLITWTVEYRHLARHLRHLEILRMVEARFGPVAVRLLRILRERGKLEEKALQDIGLIAIKDLRTLLGQMEAAGFVDLQEVPKDQQRQPSKTMYLWTFDADRVVTVQTENIYKAMSRILQRMEVERRRVRFLLEKAERSDVKGHEEKFFTAAEWKNLQEWKLKERAFLVELGRLDDLVGVFRDY